LYCFILLLCGYNNSVPSSSGQDARQRNAGSNPAPSKDGSYSGQVQSLRSDIGSNPIGTTTKNSYSSKNNFKIRVMKACEYLLNKRIEEQEKVFNSMFNVYKKDQKDIDGFEFLVAHALISTTNRPIHRYFIICVYDHEVIYFDSNVIDNDKFLTIGVDLIPRTKARLYHLSSLLKNI